MQLRKGGLDMRIYDDEFYLWDDIEEGNLRFKNLGQEKKVETFSMDDIELCLPTISMVNINSGKRLKVIEEFIGGLPTDLAVLTGGSLQNVNNLTIISEYYVYSEDDNDAYVVDYLGCGRYSFLQGRTLGIRPILKLSDSLYEQIIKEGEYNEDGILEIEFGSYPQEVLTKTEISKLNKLKKFSIKNLSSKDLIKTGNTYTFDSMKGGSTPFFPKTYKEYEYNDEYYISMKSIIRSFYGYKAYNGLTYSDGVPVWVKVSPVVWLVDEEEKILVAKNTLLSGIRGKDLIKKNYLEKYMKHDLFQSENLTFEKEEIVEEPKTKEEVIFESTLTKLINEIEYNLLKLKDINKDLYLKFKKQYEEYLRNNITDITILGSLNAEIQAEIMIKKERPIDLINYLKSIRFEYIDNFLNHNGKKTNIDLNKLDKIYEKFRKVQNKCSFEDQIDVLNNIALVYFFEVYENIDSITLEKLENSYFKDNMIRIVTYIKTLEDLGILKCSYFLFIEEELNVKTVFNMIKNIEFIKNKEENLEEVLKTL